MLCAKTPAAATCSHTSSSAGTLIHCTALRQLPLLTLARGAALRNAAPACGPQPLLPELLHAVMVALSAAHAVCDIKLHEAGGLLESPQYIIAVSAVVQDAAALRKIHVSEQAS